MISVGDKARVTKGHPSGYEDTITRMFLAASGENHLSARLRFRSMPTR